MGQGGILIVLIALAIALAGIFFARPSFTAGSTGKILAFLGLCVLPALCIAGGMSSHMQRSEQTQFCISCHSMEPYGRSLYVDDSKYVPAAHFQNHRVPPEQACYACHANYTIFGPLRDKLRGVTRIYMQYVSTPPNPIRVPGGYKTRNVCIATPVRGVLKKTRFTLQSWILSNRIKSRASVAAVTIRFTIREN